MSIRRVEWSIQIKDKRCLALIRSARMESPEGCKQGNWPPAMEPFTRLHTQPWLRAEKGENPDL